MGDNSTVSHASQGLGDSDERFQLTRCRGDSSSSSTTSAVPHPTHFKISSDKLAACVVANFRVNVLSSICNVIAEKTVVHGRFDYIGSVVVQADKVLGKHAVVFDAGRIENQVNQVKATQ